MILNIVPATVSALAVAALAALAGTTLGPHPGTARRERALMGTVASAEVSAPSEAAAAGAADAALGEIARLEGVLSTWSPSAEMTRANAAARRGSAAVSPELAEAITRGLAGARATGGAFDPVVGALVDAWDLRGSGRVPSSAELQAARRATGWELAELGAGTLRFREPAAWLDTGGFGKGLALDAAARVATDAGATSGLLDLGGQLLAFGAAPGGGWPLAVADPRDRERPALALSLVAGSVATSAQSERFVEAAGRRLGHVLDPRTGAPVDSDGSATVIAADATEADVLSTALLVLGPRRGLRLAASRGACAGFLVPDSRAGRDVLVLRATPCFLERLESAADDVVVARASSRSLPR